MNCNHCHHPNETDAVFCGACGQQLHAPTTEGSFHVGAVVADGRYRLDTLLGGRWDGHGVQSNRPLAPADVRAKSAES